VALDLCCERERVIVLLPKLLDSDALEGYGNCKLHITTHFRQLPIVTFILDVTRSQVVQRSELDPISNKFPLFEFVEYSTGFVLCLGIALPSLKLGPATPVELRY
jgi:hypothetical protein